MSFGLFSRNVIHQIHKIRTNKDQLEQAPSQLLKRTFTETGTRVFMVQSYFRSIEYMSWFL